MGQMTLIRIKAKDEEDERYLEVFVAMFRGPSIRCVRYLIFLQVFIVSEIPCAKIRFPMIYARKLIHIAWMSFYSCVVYIS